jgi:serine/threonine protein phosphatase PrpC
MKTGVWKIDGRGRPSEDRSFIRELPGGILIAGVFDGHSGLFTVDFTVKFLPVAISEMIGRINPEDEGAMRSGIKAVFIEHDKKLAKQGALSYRDSGSTATVAIVTPKRIYMAYLGDSPACVFHPTTGEIYGSIGKHDPSSQTERSRIYANGGTVTMDAGDAPRVDGCLMVSRAFGDFSMKFANGNRPTESEWSTDWANGFRVVANPDIVVVPRPVGGGILAIYSDGLVETPDGDKYRSYEHVIQGIVADYRGGPDMLEQCAKRCIEKQVASFVDDPTDYSGDDVTLVLVHLPGAPVAVTAPVISGGATGTGQTRKNKIGHRRTRSNKKRAARSFYI